jgi:hypothetical protein
VDRASPTPAGWKKIGKDLIKLEQENTTKSKTDAS